MGHWHWLRTRLRPSLVSTAYSIGPPRLPPSPSLFRLGSLGCMSPPLLVFSFYLLPVFLWGPPTTIDTGASSLAVLSKAKARLSQQRLLPPSSNSHLICSCDCVCVCVCVCAIRYTTFFLFRLLYPKIKFQPLSSLFPFLKLLTRC